MLFDRHRSGMTLADALHQALANHTEWTRQQVNATVHHYPPQKQAAGANCFRRLASFMPNREVLAPPAVNILVSRDEWSRDGFRLRPSRQAMAFRPTPRPYHVPSPAGLAGVDFGCRWAGGCGRDTLDPSGGNLPTSRGRATRSRSHPGPLLFQTFGRHGKGCS